MVKELRPAFVLLVLFTLLTGVIYPFVTTGIASVLFPYQASGSLIERDGKIIGSTLIGQSFTEARFFHGRPSATVATDPSDPSKMVAAPYNATNTGGSNLGPTSKALMDRISSDLDMLKRQNPGQRIPIDLVTASASGLDPHISPEAALFQVPRVATARGLPEARVRELVERHIEGRTLGFFGEARVNVLVLNLALEALKP